MAFNEENTAVTGFLGKATALGREFVGLKLKDIVAYA